MTTERWERRAAKLEAKKSQMRVSGRGLLTAVQAAIIKREAARKEGRLQPARSRPGRKGRA